MTNRRNGFSHFHSLDSVINQEKPTDRFQPDPTALLQSVEPSWRCLTRQASLNPKELDFYPAEKEKM